MESDQLHELVVVFLVFHNVEEADRGKPFRKEPGVLQCGSYHVLNSAPPGIRRTDRAGLKQHHFQPRILH